MGLDVSKLDKELDRLDKKLDALIKKGEKTEKAFETMFKGASAKNLLDHLDKVQSKISDISKLKDPMKWDSKSLVGYIDQVNRLLRTIEKANTAQGATPIKIINMEDLMAAKKELQTMLREVKALEKAQAQRTTSRNQTYAGAMRYSANANTLEKERQAIENLKVARDKLKQSDADYATKLNALNEAIKRHEKSLKDATKTDKDRADEAAKNAKKIADAQAKYDSISRRERYKAYTTSYEGAIRTSDKAKTLAQEIQAVKNLEAARAKLNKTDADYQKKLDEINKRILQHNKNIQQATAGAKDLEKAHSSLGTKIAAVFSIQAIRGYINQMIKVRGEMELQQRSLQAILQNKDAANEVWQKTIDLAVRSPFRIKDLVTYTKQLAAYRVEADKLYDTNKMLADVSAGLGVDMQRLILAFGQVKSANFLRGTELRQFTEAGIPMLDELAKLYTQMEGALVTSGDVFERISKRMVLFEDVEEVFKRMTAAGGTFYRMQEIQSETLKGQISNLKDSVDIMLNSMGKDMDGVLKKSVKSVKFLVDNYEVLIPILKGIIVALALYKVNSFAASEATLRMARSMKMAKVSATGLGGAWTSLRVGLAQFGKDLGKTTKMLVSNPWLLLAAAIVTAAIKLNQFRKELEEVDKKYSQLLDKQGDVYLAFRQAGQKSDLEEQVAERRKQLQALVDMAKNEYGLVIDINVGEIDESKLEEEFNKIRQKMIELNAFSASFSKEMIKSDKLSKWADLGQFGVFEEGLFEDIQDLGGSYEKLYQEMINKSGRTVEILRDIWDDLTDAQKKAVEDLEKPIQGEESLVDYVNRLKDAYTTLLEIKDVKNNKMSRFIRSFNRDVREANSEFKVFANRFREEVNGIADEKEKIEFLDVSIGAMANEKKWSEFEENYIRRLVEQEFGITFVPKTATPEELKNWQKSYNSLFEGDAGFRKITATATSQSQVIERLNGTYESLADTIEKIETAGEDSVLTGGAYEGQDLNKLKNDLSEVKEQLDWFGANGKSDDATNKVLNNRISLIRELNKKYEELNKTFDETTSKEKVIESYSQTFKKAFEGTGIDLTTRIVDEQKLKEAGGKAGETFSEGMKESMAELVEKGIYTRDLDDSAREAALNFIKNFEGVRNKAYKDIGSKKWAIGIGNNYDPETGKEITAGTVWSDEDIMRKNKIAMQTHMDALNKILDLHKDIIVTGEQYTALLDLTWQTGGAASLTYAEDRDKFIKWLEQIDKMPIVQVMKDGTRKKTGIFDIDVDQIIADYDKAETAIEKVAIAMEYVGIRNAVDKDTTDFMIKRGQERAKLFRGDLEVTKLIEKSTVNIANLDFTNLEGVAAMLKKLVPLAKKEGKEAHLALQRAISQVEVEIGVKESQEEAKKLNDEVQSLFDQYELTLSLKKLRFPQGMAEELFDTKYLDLKGLREAVQAKEGEFVGTKQEEEYKKFLDKIDEMERKSIVERTKTYAEYLVRGMTERTKLKIEELRKLKELEESKEFTADQKKQIREQIQIDSQKQLDKAKWAQFTGMDSYVMMFEDLETLGTESIRNLYEQLDKLRLNLSHLDPSEVKEIVNQMEKLQEELISRNPFKAFRAARDEIKAIGEDEATLVERLFSKEKIESEAQAMIESIAAIENAFSEGTFDELRDEDKNLFDSFMPQFAEGKDLAAIKEGYQQILDDAREGKEITSDQLKDFADYRKSLQGISDYWGAINDQIQNITGSAVNIMEVYGVDEATKSIAEGVGSMSTLIMQAIQFGIQMELVGYKSNMALGVIGWIAMGIQAISTVITAIANYKNAKIDKQLEKQAKTIERQRDLYEELEKKVDAAYSVDQLRQYNDEMERNIELEIQALEASIMAERSRKNADEDQIADWQKEITEARERLAESKQEMMEELGGMFDITDFTGSFVDAWWDAMDEGKSGLDALSEHFEETMRDMVKKQALYQGANAIMKQVQDVINQDLADDYDIDDWQKIWDVAKKANIDLDAFLQGWYDMFGGLSDGASGGLSALQKGIQGVSEETAQVIEAYLNSIRGYVSEQVTHTRNIYRILNDAVHSDAAAIRVRMV